MDFTRDEVRKRMNQNASIAWQIRVKDVEAADPLVRHLMDSCAFEIENVAKSIEETRQHILDRLASVMCPEVIDLPRPAHAVFHAHPEEEILDLPQTAQFFHRQIDRESREGSRDIFFSPVVNSRLVNGEVNFVISEQGIFQQKGRDRYQLERSVQSKAYTSYQSVWLGIELGAKVPSLSSVSFYFDWENESAKDKDTYYRKLQDPAQTSWYLNGQKLAVQQGFQSIASPESQLVLELDVLNGLESEVMADYNRCFVSLGEVPDQQLMSYDPRPYPAVFQFSDQQQRYFKTNLVWVEIRLSRDFPRAAIAKMDARINCFPVMNRHLNETIQRLQQTLNIFSLQSAEEFLFIRRVYDTESYDLYRSSPLRNVDELEENSFMWRPHGIGRFDVRNAREVLHYVQQMLLEESKAFSALGSGLFTQTIENLNKNVEELSQRLQNNVDEGFKIGHPYIFVKPRKRDSNVHIEYWSTNGKGANHIQAGTRLTLYGGEFFMRDEKDDLFLVTATSGGRDKPSVTEKEYQLRRSLLTRNRLVTREDIKAECLAYFYDLAGGIRVDVDVETSFAEGLLEGAGYVRCIDVLIMPYAYSDLNQSEWETECERCRRHLERKSAMNLPYRIRLTSPAR